MLVGDVRKGIVKTVERVMDSGNEESTARVMTYARAALMALAQLPPDEQINLQKLTVRTGPAARIMGLHPEYVRNLARRGNLKADKENGEYRIALSAVVEFMLVTGSRAETVYLGGTPFLSPGTVIAQPPEDDEPEEAKGAA